jgi:hypothetical protein
MMHAFVNVEIRKIKVVAPQTKDVVVRRRKTPWW